MEPYSLQKGVGEKVGFSRVGNQSRLGGAVRNRGFLRSAATEYGYVATLVKHVQAVAKVL